MTKALFEFATTHLIQVIVFGGLAALVIVTALWAKPRQSFVGFEYASPLGARIILCFAAAVWALLVYAPFDLGKYGLAAFFALGFVYLFSRWPVTILVDELRIHRNAWCRPYRSLLWTEIQSISLSASGDCLVLRDASGTD
jgi:hypothetical protein